MANWNGSCEDWLHGDEDWQDAIDEYPPVDNDELNELREALTGHWKRLQREIPAIEVTK